MGFLLIYILYKISQFRWGDNTGLDLAHLPGPLSTPLTGIILKLKKI
jgi:hypothetical protein